MSNKDISSFQIDHSKIWADGEKYFSLFEKHIPELNAGQKVLVYAIDNLDVICKLMDRGNGAEFWIFGNSDVNAGVKALGYDFNEIPDDDFSKTYNIPDMKFDCIIMNPPYEKNLHLKILAEAITHLKDDNSKCVNLSPVRWLQDPMAKYKKRSDFYKFEKSIVNHCKTIDFINSEDSANMFENRLNVQLGVYEAVMQDSFKYDSSVPLLDKCYDKIKNSNVEPHIKYSEPNNYACVVSLICGGAAGWTEKCPPIWMMSREKSYYTNNKNYKGQTYKEYRDEIIWGNLKPKSEVTHIEFNSEIERENFYKSWYTKCLGFIYKSMMVDVHVHPEFLPWMGDAINPRTGLKGYESEWTDEDFVLYFGITPEEYNIIKQTMEKYK